MLGHSGCRPFQGWSWGGMRHHPFQPRVLYRQAVLSPARWLLPRELARERAHAGVLQCAASRHPEVASEAASAITMAFDAGRPFAIPHTDNGAIEDHPGFLTGAAGTALALAEHGRLPAPAVPDRWDCLLLLS
jgi:Lantibiotic dehydratase, N terminus